MQQSQPRSAGVEHVALHALAQLGFVEKLVELGVNGVACAAILGNVVGRMAQPAFESVFRSLKPVLSEVEGSELGLRPAFHSKEDRSDGHLFITVLAYQCVRVLRLKLKAAGINDSWASLRQTLPVQRRITASQRRKDGRTIHVRKSSLAELALMNIYKALGVNPAPGGAKKMLC